MPSVDDHIPAGPRDPAAFRATVLRRATRIERRRRLTRAGGWAMGIAAVTLSAFALARTQQTSGQATSTPTPTLNVVGYRVASGVPWAIMGGADGNLWVSERDSGHGSIVRFGLDGQQTSFALPSGAQPAGIVAGPDGALWFTDPGRSAIGRITTTGTVTEFSTPAPPGDTLAVAPDSAIWFGEPTANRMARMTGDGHVSQVALPAGTHPDAIATGPDGGIWFGESGAATLARVDATGAVSTIHVADAAERVTAAATGPGPAVWFITTSPTGARLGRIDTTGHVIEQAIDSPTVPATLTLGPDGRLWLPGPTPGTARTVTATRTTLRALSVRVRIDGIATGSDGNVWVVDRANRQVARIDIP